MVNDQKPLLNMCLFPNFLLDNYRNRSQTGADRPCVHTRPPLSDPVLVCYPY